MSFVFSALAQLPGEEVGIQKSEACNSYGLHLFCAVSLSANAFFLQQARPLACLIRAAKCADVFSPFVLTAVMAGCRARCLVCFCSASHADFLGRERPPGARCDKGWGRSRPFRVFARVQISIFDSHIFFFQVGLRASYVESRSENRFPFRSPLILNSDQIRTSYKAVRRC
jgi:hypothetical protein